MIDNKNKIYILTIEYNSETEEIEYIAEEIVDNRQFEEVGSMDMEEQEWDLEALEYMRKHYESGDA